MRSPQIIILAPLVFFMALIILAQLLKYLIYKIIDKEPRTKPAVVLNEQPILVLEYNKIQQIIFYRIVLIISIIMCIFSLFIADDIAREAMDRGFLYLSGEQTYALYYWSWNLSCTSWLFMSCTMSINFLYRKVIFYRNAVVVDNYISGRTALALDEDVKRNECGNYIWIYNEKRGLNLPIFNENLMRLDNHQAKLLEEILGKIPQKNKKMMLI